MRFALTMVVGQRERKQAAFERYLPNLFSGGWASFAVAAAAAPAIAPNIPPYTI